MRSEVGTRLPEMAEPAPMMITRSTITARIIQVNLECKTESNLDFLTGVCLVEI